MNEKEFIVLYYIYKSSIPVYLRQIVKDTKLPYGTVQSILNRNLGLLDVNVSGKNKYFSIRRVLSNYYFAMQLEMEATKQFIKDNPKLSPFIDQCIALDIPIIIFGSFSNGTADKNSDLDILMISDDDIKLPEHLCPFKIHKISVKYKNLPKFREEVLYSEIISGHIIINGFEVLLKYEFRKMH